MNEVKVEKIEGVNLEEMSWLTKKFIKHDQKKVAKKAEKNTKKVQNDGTVKTAIKKAGKIILISVAAIGTGVAGYALVRGRSSTNEETTVPVTEPTEDDNDVVETDEDMTEE